MTPHGYHGCYLRVDLSSGESTSVPLTDSVLRQYLGGSGLGVYLLLHEGTASVDPLAPEAPLCFVFSPLVGSPLTTSAKFAVVSKSPLTQRLNDSLASSGFAIAGKQSGCDAIVLTGRAAQPSVLVIDNGHVRLESAQHLWGLPTDSAAKLLREQLGPDYRVATIGPAGERLVRFATISHDGRHAGRGGSGTVMGAKNLKAIAVRGQKRCSWAQPKKLVALAKSVSKKSFGPATAKYRELGTAANLLTMNRLASLPTRNFQQGRFEGAALLSPEQLSVVHNKTRAHCAACTIGCEHIYALDGGDPKGSNGVRVEYENLFALGPLCGIDESQIVLQASQRCDQLGLDTISTGGTIAFAMECVDKGLLDAPWLRFGDGGALLQAIEWISERKDVGALLAEGSRLAAQQLGPQAVRVAPHVKGLELPGYEPRALQTMALGFTVGSRGADHNRSGAYEVDFSDQVDRRNAGAHAALLAIDTENRAALMDSLILCKFLRGIFHDPYTEWSEMLNLVTGWDTTADELRQTARRVVTAKKHFNVLAGWTPQEDTLPDRFLEEPLADDPRARLTRDRLQSLVEAYNEGRDWTPEGWIPPDQLCELDIIGRPHPAEA